MAELLAPIPAQSELSRWRGVIGASAGLWARDELRVEPHWWRALSGSRHPDYNVVCGHHPDAREPLLESLAALGARKLPGLCMLAGEGLGLARDLADEGLVCITSTPLVLFSLDGWVPDPAARLLGPGERDAAWAIVAESFGLDASVAAVALPLDGRVAGTSDTGAPRAPDRTYGLVEDGRLVSVVGMSGDGPVISGWSMATPPGLRRRGYGARLMQSAFVMEAAGGATSLVALSSPDGLPLYLSRGAVIVEWWQVWSRPRWVFGR